MDTQNTSREKLKRHVDRIMKRKGFLALHADERKRLFLLERALENGNGRADAGDVRFVDDIRERIGA